MRNGCHGTILEDVDNSERIQILSRRKVMRKLIMTALLLCASGVCLGETTDEMVKRKEAARERAKQTEATDEETVKRKEVVRDRAKRIKAQVAVPVRTKTTATKRPLRLGEVETISGVAPTLSPGGVTLTAFDLPGSAPGSASPNSTPQVGFTTPATTPNCASPGPCMAGFGKPPGK